MNDKKVTPPPDLIRDEAISLRYDYGLSELAIMTRLSIPQRTISHWVSHNSHSSISHNNGHITHLEGDCLEILQTLPNKKQIGRNWIPAYSRLLGFYPNRLRLITSVAKMLHFVNTFVSTFDISTWTGRDSNPQPIESQSIALSIELPAQVIIPRKGTKHNNE